MMQQIILPGWLELAICIAVRQIESEISSADDLAILTRLATDIRMQNVWQELSRHKRHPNNGYVHPARQPPQAPQRTPDEAQAAAMAETLNFAFCTARDDRRVSKLEDVEPTRKALLAETATLRQLANELIASVRAERCIDLFALAEADADALRRVANWRECKASEIRGADDPMTITNNRGDPLERGVQTDIASFLEDRFGHHLHGIAATLTAVALGLSETPSVQISRSGFSRQKRA